MTLLLYFYFFADGKRGFSFLIIFISLYAFVGFGTILMVFTF